MVAGAGGVCKPSWRTSRVPSSITCLIVDAGCWLGAQLGMKSTMVRSPHSTTAGFQEGKSQKRAFHAIKGRSSRLLRRSLPTHSHFHCFFWSSKSLKPRFRGRELDYSLTWAACLYKKGKKEEYPSLETIDHTAPLGCRFVY